jgi:hypothetical protein
MVTPRNNTEENIPHCLERHRYGPEFSCYYGTVNDRYWHKADISAHPD